MIDEGKWKARGCEGALGVAGSGNEQVGVDLEILEGPSQGAHITWYGHFTEGSFERTIESLRLLGWEGRDLSELRGIGRTEVMVTVSHEANNQTGEIQARANWINPVGGVVMKNRMEPAAAKAFAVQLMGRVLAADAKRGPLQPAHGNAPAAQRMAQQRPTVPAPGNVPPTTTNTSAAPAEGPADDNIPF